MTQIFRYYRRTEERWVEIAPRAYRALLLQKSMNVELRKEASEAGRGFILLCPGCNRLTLFRLNKLSDGTERWDGVLPFAYSDDLAASALVAAARALRLDLEEPDLTQPFTLVC